MFEAIESIVAPVAHVREAFDEQTLKRQWDEACADEQDATERKCAVLQAALKRWPKVPNGFGGKQMKHSPEMRRFVRDVLGMPDNKGRGGMNNYAARLLKHGMEGARANSRSTNARQAVGVKLRRAVIELTTKYRLGADPTECMEALDTYYKELTDGKA